MRKARTVLTPTIQLRTITYIWWLEALVAKDAITVIAYFTQVTFVIAMTCTNANDATCAMNVQNYLTALDALDVRTAPI
tara:strand:+ start:45 stop:281 length:237 start_codon:yes stop_codon:yes gene_type:complete